MPVVTKDYGERVAGLHYLDFLRNLHVRLGPRTYLEVGVRTGDALALARCASIGIDPRFGIGSNVVRKKPVLLLFQETSDEFFAARDPVALFGGPVEMAFLDGMHLLEFLLRDFINIERHCRHNGIVLIHDCVPPHLSMTTRDAKRIGGNPYPYRDWWTGDVWKVVPILRQYRPDLSIELVDCAPTGLGLITNLDPASRVLSDAYDDIIAAHVTEESDAAQFDRYWDGLAVTLSTDLMGPRQLERYRFDSEPAASP